MSLPWLPPELESQRSWHRLDKHFIADGPAKDVVATLHQGLPWYWRSGGVMVGDLEYGAKYGPRKGLDAYYWDCVVLWEHHTDTGEWIAHEQR